MDGDSREFEDQPQDGQPADGNLSASYLPYDDSRLWLQMPDGGQPAKKRRRERPAKPPKESRPKDRRKERVAGSEGAPTPVRPEPRGSTTTKPRRPIPRWVARSGVAIAALVLPITAIAMVRLSSAGTPQIVVPDGGPNATPSVAVLDIQGLQATTVSFRRVTLEWQAPLGTESFSYTIYRDGNVYAQSSEPTFTDRSVEPQTYYYYAVTATGSAGSLAASVQLLVAVPSETGALPTEPPPPPPAPPVIAPSPTLSPSPSPSPRPSFVRGGGGGGGGGTVTTPPPTTTPCDPTNPTGGCYDPCLVGDPACPTSTSPSPPPPTTPPCDPTDPLGGCYDPCLVGDPACPTSTTPPPPPPCDPNVDPSCPPAAAGSTINGPLTTTSAAVLAFPAGIVMLLASLGLLRRGSSDAPNGGRSDGSGAPRPRRRRIRRRSAS